MAALLPLLVIHLHHARLVRAGPLSIFGTSGRNRSPKSLVWTSTSGRFWKDWFKGEETVQRTYEGDKDTMQRHNCCLCRFLRHKCLETGQPVSWVSFTTHLSCLYPFLPASMPALLKTRHQTRWIFSQSW